jgi:hypothetical protein
VNDQASRALAEAVRLAEHGYRLTPVTITRLPSGKKAARFHKGWRHEGAWSDDPEMIRQWWVDNPDTSFALGGGANGIEGVDLDVKPQQGIDAVEWWNAQGLPGSAFTQATPSGGIHLIWRANPDRGLPQEAGKTFGRGVDTRNRGGLFFAAGAYVVGEPGHYETLADLVKLEDLPHTPPVVLDLFADHGRTVPAERAVDGRIVPHDEDWQQRVVAEAVQAIRDHDRNTGGYRAKLMGAGLLLGRAVEQGFLDQPRALAILTDAHRSLWGDSVWPENLADMRAALVDGPRLERWRVPELAPAGQLVSPGPTEDPEQATPVHDHVQGSSSEQVNSITSTNGGTWDVAPGEDGYDPEAKAAERRAKLDADAIENEARKRMARRVVSASEREPIRVLSGLAFLAGEDLEYLVPSMFYKSSTAKVFGPPGGTKSYLILDLALCLATGRPWRGQRLGRHRVHYVMAEGEPVNRLRTRGWLHHYDVDPAELEGWLTVIPQGVLLTPEGVADYLPRVEADAPALVILDTKNAMMDGDESSPSDAAVMVRALRAIRDAAAGACVLLVDHTGLFDETRGRGTNAVMAAMDTEILVTRDRSGLASAKVTRDKAADPGYTAYYRLHAVEDVPRKPGVKAPAVCLETQRDTGEDPFGTDEDWFVIGVPLPDDVVAWKGKGRAAVPALARYMRYSANTGMGHSYSSARKAVQARCRDDHRQPLWSDDTVERAWDALIELGRLQPGTSKGSPATWLARPDDPS